MRIRMLGALLIGGLAACAGTDPVTDPRTQAEVKARFDAWVQAWNWAKPADLEPFYAHTEHLTVAWPNGERTRGWSEEAQFQQNFLPTVSVMNLAARNPNIVLVRSNLALVTFDFSLDLLAGGTRQIGPGHGMMLWQNENGAWRIYAAQLSTTGAVQAQLGAPPRRSGAR